MFLHYYTHTEYVTKKRKFFAEKKKIVWVKDEILSGGQEEIKNRKKHIGEVYECGSLNYWRKKNSFKYQLAYIKIVFLIHAVGIVYICWGDEETKVNE